MTLQGLSWIVIANGLVQLAGLLAIIVMAVQAHREHREIMRLSRGVAGLVYQENEKIRARLDELFGSGSGGSIRPRVFRGQPFLGEAQGGAVRAPSDGSQ